MFLFQNIKYLEFYLGFKDILPATFYSDFQFLK